LTNAELWRGSDCGGLSSIHVLVEAAAAATADMLHRKIQFITVEKQHRHPLRLLAVWYF
jgi:hypothetical protein